MENIKKIKAEHEALAQRVLNDIYEIMASRDIVDFWDEKTDKQYDLAVGFRDAETDCFPNVNAVIKDEDGQIRVECDICGSYYDIPIKDVELSLLDLIGILEGMHEMLGI